MLMIIGKSLLMKLFRDRSAQLGDDFVLKQFLDDVVHTGQIPFTLIRWQVIFSALFSSRSLSHQSLGGVFMHSAHGSPARGGRQMTGETDEIEALLPPPGQLCDVPLA